jgi:tRNA pseudouridine55 synthase
MVFSPQQFIEGTYLLIDKFKGWTSFDVIAKIRNPIQKVCTNRKLKIGHAGTLDPMATGLLLIATGPFTKKMSELQNLDKEYTGTIKLGANTASYDAETPIIHRFDISLVTDEKIVSAAKIFSGEMAQIPPSYSSISVAGVRAYKKAREGEIFQLQPRTVHVYEFELTQINIPEINFRIRCSKGTYIRSIAHDLGKKLGCGGYLTELRRTKIGEYKIENAYTIDNFLKTITG